MKAFRGQHPVALKTLRKTPHSTTKERSQLYYFEVLLWSTFCHPNINPLLGVDVGPSADVSMVSKLICHGTLLEYLQVHPDADKFQLLSRIADAISYLHGLPNPVLHGDIRAMNILVDDKGSPLLIDFSCSQIINPTQLQFIPSAVSFHGSIRWMAPEKMRPSEYPLTLKMDSYSFACLCLEVFTGKLPFSHLSNDGAVVVEVLARQRHPPRPQCAELTDPLWDSMVQCWQRDPSYRPLVRGMRDLLSPEELVLSMSP
jgi:serine/threonine protein kinase